MNLSPLPALQHQALAPLLLPHHNSLALRPLPCGVEVRFTDTWGLHLGPRDLWAPMGGLSEEQGAFWKALNQRE